MPIGLVMKSLRAWNRKPAKTRPNDNSQGRSTTICVSHCVSPLGRCQRDQLRKQQISSACCRQVSHNVDKRLEVPPCACRSRCKQAGVVLEFLINEKRRKSLRHRMSRARVYASGPLKRKTSRSFSASSFPLSLGFTSFLTEQHAIGFWVYLF